jgi:hypothetical protein
MKSMHRSMDGGRFGQIGLNPAPGGAATGPPLRPQGPLRDDYAAQCRVVKDSVL